MVDLFITWNVTPEIVNIGGLSIRYYGLLFALAFLLGFKIEEKIFSNENLSKKWLDKLWIYVAIATIVGARLGHCIFYDWAYFGHHIIEIFLPIRLEPHFKFIGYQGLASHGAAIGIIIGLWYYSKKISKKSLLWILDRVVIPVALAGVFIRTGNLMNSEIVGVPTTLPWGFKFIHAYCIANPDLPRHPAQIYEAICYLITFLTIMHLYWKTNAKEKIGLIFGVFLLMIFLARFFIEFLKENQESFENTMSLNMGQLLSIPFVLFGIYLIYRELKKEPKLKKSVKLGK